MFLPAMKCPANSHYEVCANNWALTCPGLTDIVPATQECTEGCECNDGFLFDGEKCIIKKKCGCFDNGRSYKVKVNMLDANAQISFLGFCQLNCITALTMGGKEKKNYLCAHLPSLQCPCTVSAAQGGGVRRKLWEKMYLQARPRPRL